MKHLVIGFLFLLASAFAPAANAQDNRIGVYFNSTADDATGRQIVFYLRDEVRKSGSFRDATKDDSVFTVNLVTLDPYGTGVNTIYSYAITISNGGPLDYYVTSYVGICGKDSTRSCAQSLFGGLGEQLEQLLQVLKAQQASGFNR